MRSNFLPVFAISALLSMSLFGCASDDPKGKEGSGVDSDKLVSELSKAEARQLCVKLSQEESVLRQAVERAGCIGPVLGEDECEAERKRCISMAKLVDRTEECDEDAEAVTGGEDCEATVGQLEECFTTIAEDAAEYAEQVTCDKSPEDLPEQRVPKACSEIAADCSTVSAFGSGG